MPHANMTPDPDDVEAVEKPVLCEECETYPADWPSKLCPGCEAYREHTEWF